MDWDCDFATVPPYLARPYSGACVGVNGKERGGDGGREGESERGVGGGREGGGGDSRR